MQCVLGWCSSVCLMLSGMTLLGWGLFKLQKYCVANGRKSTRHRWLSTRPNWKLIV